MPRGRPPAVMLDPGNAGPIARSVANVDIRGRVHLPGQIVAPLNWIPPGEPAEALAILDEPGRITLHSWNEYGDAVIERRRELIRDAEQDTSLLEPLQVLEGRYKRLHIPLSRRPTLTAEMVLHLGISLVSLTPLYVWRIADRIELASKAHHNQTLSVKWDQLDNLP